MSARLWKTRLEETQTKLTDATTAAREWKKVAENRLEILHRLDESMRHQLHALTEVGEIFGVRTHVDCDAWTDTSDMDAAGTAMYLMGKLEICSSYLRDLMETAAKIQVTLDDTWDLAQQALQVAPPSSDLTIPKDLQYVTTPSAPLTDLAAKMNNLGTMSPHEEHGDRRDSVASSPGASYMGEETALSLFQR
jgi:hypothetical protein